MTQPLVEGRPGRDHVRLDGQHTRGIRVGRDPKTVEVLLRFYGCVVNRTSLRGGTREDEKLKKFSVPDSGSELPSLR